MWIKLYSFKSEIKFIWVFKNKIIYEKINFFPNQNIKVYVMFFYHMENVKCNYVLTIINYFKINAIIKLKMN
jgi:hypothetical protein